MRREPMDEPLDEVFDSLRPVPPPDSERQAAYRATLLARARQQRRRAALSDRAARPPWWRRGAFRFLPQQRWATAGVLVALVLILFAGTSGVIYAADGAAPGDPLYGLDRAAEAVQLRLTRDPQATAGLLLALANERLEEVQALSSAKKDRKHLAAALDNYGASISSLAQALGDLDGADPATLTALVDEALTVHEVQLGYLLPAGGAATPPGLTGDAGPKAGKDVPSSGAEGDSPDGDEPPEADDPAEGEEPPEGDEPPDGDDPSPDCVGADPHPVAWSLAESYGVDYEEIMLEFCSGYGIGEIVHALQTSEATDDPDDTFQDILAMKTDLGGWGQVWQELGLIGKGAKEEGAPDDPDLDTNPKKPGGPKPKKNLPGPAGPKPKENKPDNPGQSKKNKP